MRPSALVALALASSTLGPAGVGLAQQPTRAYVLDEGAPALVALELPAGRRVGSLELQGSPAVLVQSPDGSRLVVLDRGPGEDKGRRGYKAAGKSSALVVDAATLTVVGRVELGSGVAAGRWSWGPDSRRLTVLCPGYEAKNPAEALPRELVNVDVTTGREAGRLGLEPGTLPVAASEPGQALALIQGLPRDEKFPYPKSRLFVVDLAGPSLRARLDLESWISLYVDGTRLYLLDPGKPDDDPQRNRNGTVQVVSLEQGSLVGSHGAGRRPRRFYPDAAGGQVFIPSDGPPGAVEGALRVVRGTELAATVGVTSDPRLVVRQQDVVYVVGENAVTLVDPIALRVTQIIPLVHGRRVLVDATEQPTDLEVSPDGKRAFVHYGLHHKVVTIDLEARRCTGSTRTGRGGRKLLGNAMWGLFGYLGQAAVDYPGRARTSPRMLAVRPDGGYAYAAHNQTKDITVVDGATGRSAGMIAGDAYALELLKGGRFLLAVSEADLRLIDLERNAVAAQLPLPELRGLYFTADRSLAVALAKQAVVVLDGASGSELARLTDFVSPSALVFAARP